jgi:hypothetical protein
MSTTPVSFSDDDIQEPVSFSDDEIEQPKPITFHEHEIDMSKVPGAVPGMAAPSAGARPNVQPQEAPLLPALLGAPNLTDAEKQKATQQVQEGIRQTRVTPMNDTPFGTVAEGVKQVGNALEAGHEKVQRGGGLANIRVPVISPSGQVLQTVEADPNPAYENALMPAAKAGNEFVGSMETPTNLALMGGLSLIPTGTLAGKALHTAINGYFAGKMGSEGIQQAYQGYLEQEQGHIPEAVKNYVGAVLNTAMAGETTKGAAETGKAVTEDIGNKVAGPGPIVGYAAHDGKPIYDIQKSRSEASGSVPRGTETRQSPNEPAPPETPVSAKATPISFSDADIQAAPPAEPQTGRPVLQPSDQPAELNKAAEVQAPTFEKTLQDAVKGIEGAKVDGVRESKEPERVAEKVQDEGKPAETISDYLAGRIAVDSRAARDQAVESIRKQFPVVKEEDEFEQGKEPYGFRAHTLQVELPNKMTAELQIVPREISEVNDQTHPDYEKARAAETAGDQETFQKHAAAAKAVHDEAMQRFNQREQATGKGAQITRTPLADLALDPKRFQYKLNTNQEGTTDLLTGNKWNDNLAGIVTAWRDPADGKLYVINGHHRVSLAKENGVGDMAVRILDPKDAPTAAAARSIGALQNIAEGRGTTIDAAKFFRESGYTPDDLDKNGISLREKTAADGLALSHLTQSLFDDVVSGRLREGRAVAIANAAQTPEQQESLVKLIDKSEAKGKRVSDDTINELGRMVRSAGTKTETQDTLFGAQEQTRNLALEKAEVSSYIRNQISQERRTFAGVSTEQTAQRLAREGKNKINAAHNAKVAEQAGQAQELYDRLSIRTGDVDAILNRASEEIANGDNPAAVKARAYEAVRQSLSQALSGREASEPERAKEVPEPKPAPEEVAPTLPGMESAVAEQRDAAAEESGRQLSDQMRAPAPSIEKTAGEMERNSPLFAETEANPQGGLFSQPEASQKPAEDMRSESNDLPAVSGESAGETAKTTDKISASGKEPPQKSVSKGSSVLLPDGTPAKVDYYNEAMKRGRVTTADGKKLDTVRGADMTPIAEVKPGQLKSGTEREKKFMDRTIENGPQLVAEYLKKNTTNGVPYIGTDQAKALFPEYRENPTELNDDINQPAAAIAHAAWETALSRPPEGGKDLVRILTGSPASGKTTAIKASAGSDRVGIDKESILTDMPYGRKMIQQVLDSGRQPEVHLVYTTDPKVNVERMIERAKATGRPVSLDYMANAYVKVPQIVEELQGEFGSKIRIDSFDNAGTDPVAHYGTAKPAVEAASKYTLESALEVMHEELERLRQEGRVPDAIYEAVRGLRPSTPEERRGNIGSPEKGIEGKEGLQLERPQESETPTPPKGGVSAVEEKPSEPSERSSSVDDAAAKTEGGGKEDAVHEQVSDALHEREPGQGRSQGGGRVQPVERGNEVAGEGKPGEEGTGSAPKEDEKVGIGNRLYSGAAIADPEVWKALFPGMREKLGDAVREKITDADMEKGILREKRGELDRKKSQLYEALKSTAREWSDRSAEQSREFIASIEGGKIADIKNQQDRALAENLRSMLDGRRDVIRELKPGALEDFIQNYFPHIWENPSKAENVFSKILGSKRPFQGPASFLKQRTIPTTEDGIAKGLKPVTYNPVDLALLKLHEMDRYIMAHDALKTMKETPTAEGKLAQYIKVGDHPPEGWSQLDDRIGTVYDRGENGELIIRGHYYAPAEAAAVFNRNLSRGLAGRSRAFDLYRGASNTLNAAQLGISAYHLGFTSMDAGISDVALGIQKLSQGKASGAIDLVRGYTPGLSAVTNWIKGNQLLKEYLKPGSFSQLAREADWVAKSGGRAFQDPFYSNEAIRGFKTAMKDGRYLTAAARAFPATVELAAKPIMEWVVPRQKLGVFSKMAENILDRSDSENWNPDKTRAEMQKAWDSVDNRMGQLVYDNLFWNRVAKDLGVASVRSMGWNLGTIREIGGGAKDTAIQAGRALSGQNAEVTTRMAYVIGLMTTAGLWGATYGYLNGHKPEEMKDYFFPKDADGKRVSLPSYMKDIYAWRQHPLQTAGHKIHPAISEALDMLQNKDFYGTEIRNADDPWMKQVLSEAEYVGKGFVPFAIRNAQQRATDAGDTNTFSFLKPRNLGKAAQSFIGITPAPAYIQNSPALTKAREYLQENRPPGTKTQAQAERQQVMHAISDMYRNGRVDRDRIQQYIKDGKITGDDARKALIASKSDPLVTASRSLSIEQLLNVYDEASTAEKKTLRPVMVRRSEQIRNIADPATRKIVTQRFRDLLRGPQGPEVAQTIQ